MSLLWFIIGLFVGSFVGFGTAALCIAAKQGDEQLEDLYNAYKMDRNQTVK